jgi:hypothetical protein
MARVSTIRRLHAGEQKPKISELQQPEDGRVKSANFADSQPAVATPSPERGVRGRFSLGRAEPETYSLAPAMILSSIGETAPVDRNLRFRELAERERILRLARAHFHGAGYARDPFAA